MKINRFDKTVEYLKANGNATLHDLAEIGNVSEDTVRRDLILLEEKGVVRRVRGGAVICDDDPRKKSFGIRSVFHHDEKHELCNSLKEIIKDGITVSLNNGTTNIEAAKFLCENFQKLNIITNSLEVIAILLEERKFNVIVPGGILDMQEKSLYGSDCEKQIGNYNVDVALLAVNAISLEKGITDFRFNEVGIIKSMIKAAKKSYVLADSSKFEETSCVNVSPLSEVSGVLTDKALPKDMKTKYENANVMIYTA